MHTTVPQPVLRTVVGDLVPGSVRGPALAHEHLVLDLDHRGDGAAVLHPDRHAAAVTAELAALREEFGLGLVVELTCRGMGRDAATLARIARDAQVAVVAATGWYYEPFHTPEIAAADIDELTATLVREIGTGIGSTGIRPGVLGEIGSHGDTPTAAETKVLRAAARARPPPGCPSPPMRSSAVAASPNWSSSPPRAWSRTASASATRTFSTIRPCTGSSRRAVRMSRSTPSARTATRATTPGCGCCSPCWRPGMPTGFC